MDRACDAGGCSSKVDIQRNWRHKCKLSFLDSHVSFFLCSILRQAACFLVIFFPLMETTLKIYPRIISNNAPDWRRLGLKMTMHSSCIAIAAAVPWYAMESVLPKRLGITTAAKLVRAVLPTCNTHPVKMQLTRKQMPKHRTHMLSEKIRVSFVILQTHNESQPSVKTYLQNIELYFA